jgi:hypothetical protein
MLRNKRDSVLPPARLYRAELEWLKTQADQRNISFSEYLRLRLLHPGKLRRVSTKRAERLEKQGQKTPGIRPRERALPPIIAEAFRVNRDVAFTARQCSADALSTASLAKSRACGLRSS